MGRCCRPAGDGGRSSPRIVARRPYVPGHADARPAPTSWCPSRWPRSGTPVGGSRSRFCAPRRCPGARPGGVGGAAPSEGAPDVGRRRPRRRCRDEALGDRAPAAAARARVARRTPASPSRRRRRPRMLGAVPSRSGDPAEPVELPPPRQGRKRVDASRARTWGRVPRLGASCTAGRRRHSRYVGRRAREVDRRRPRRALLPRLARPQPALLLRRGARARSADLGPHTWWSRRSVDDRLRCSRLLGGAASETTSCRRGSPHSDMHRARSRGAPCARAIRRRNSSSTGRREDRGHTGLKRRCAGFGLILDAAASASPVRHAVQPV